MSSVELAPSTTSSNASCSSSNEQEYASCISSHIVELSEIIVREIGSNTWDSSATKTMTIFHVQGQGGKKKKLLLHGHDHSGDKSTYEPSFLSMGPYYSGDNGTAEMRRNEQGKLSLMRSILEEGGRSTILEYTAAAASMEAAARSCYEGDVGMHRDAFCKMLLLDAWQLIKLLECFGGEAGGEGGISSAPTSSSQEDSCKSKTKKKMMKKWFLGRRWRRRQAAAVAGDSSLLPITASSHHGSSAAEECRIITGDMCMTLHDLMMLENQIPFFVVEKMYELRHGDATATHVRKLAWGAMEAIMADVPTAHHCLDDGKDDELHHLVHLCHLYLKPSCLTNQPRDVYVTKLFCRDDIGGGGGKYGRFRRATEYYDAGVKFRRWCAEEPATRAMLQRPALDVAFTGGGVLWMARQSIDEKTGYILANVLAYEQKYYRAATSGGGSYVTAYVVFMSQLLAGADDVALLSRRGVMEHYLGSDAEVCALFRGLADGLVFDPNGDHYLKPVGAALQRHCRHRRYRWRAWIVRHRFGNPWLGAAWVFGAFAVLCTIIQTVFAVLSYVQQG